MKSKKLISLLLSVFIIMSLFALTGCDNKKALTEEEKLFIEEVKNSSSQYYKNLLTDEKEIQLYDDILTAAVLHDKDYVIKHHDSDTVNKISLYITLDVPFVALTDNLLEYRMTHDMDSEIIDFLTEFDMPFSMNYEDKRDEIKESIIKAKEIIDSMPEYEDDYSRAKYFHDYLAANVSYSIEPETTVEHCTPYSALINNTGKCESYSRAYALLCNLAGMEAFMVMYDQVQSEEGVGHMWNMVKIDGEYYHVDVTHDSFTADIGYPKNYVAYDYFLTDESTLSEPDLISPKIRDIIPDAPDGGNFFERNGLLFTSYNRNTVGKKTGEFLKTQKEEGFCGVSIKFTDKSDYDKAVNTGEFRKLLYVISQNDGYGAKTYNYGTNKKHLIIRIHPVN